MRARSAASASVGSVPGDTSGDGGGGGGGGEPAMFESMEQAEEICAEFWFASDGLASIKFVNDKREFGDYVARITRSFADAPYLVCTNHHRLMLG